MTIKLTTYDPADFLDNEEDYANYLEATVEETGGNPDAIVAALAAIARAQNMTKVAEAAKMSRRGLYKVFSPDGNPSFANVASIAKALGLSVRFQVIKPDRVLIAKRTRGKTAARLTPLAAARAKVIATPAAVPKKATAKRGQPEPRPAPVGRARDG